MRFDSRAQEDFRRAFLKGAWRRLASWLTGEDNRLLPFDDVRTHLQIRGQRYLGLRQVPIGKIVGSVGRYRDFDRAFLPTRETIRDRWVSIDQAHYQDVLLPPVELYKIGEAYFVKDGNHRVSVARERGQEEIDAYVTEIDVPVPLTPDVELDDLARLADQGHFADLLALLRELRPDVDFTATVPGSYARLREHVAVHGWFLGEKEGRPVSREEALTSWYDHVYLPLARLIRELHVLDEFPGRTVTDLYLWVIERHWYLRESQGGEVPLEHAIESLTEEQPRRRRRRRPDA